jgi:tripartite-type tricarboxylate transporter receptor subunit TctC
MTVKRRRGVLTSLVKHFLLVGKKDLHTRIGRVKDMLKVIGATTLLVAFAWSSPHASADEYPSRPITLVVPSAAGGPTDTLSRILVEHMRQTLGQPIIIENQGSAGGTVAVGRVARAASDGYTISIGQYGNYVLNGAIYSLPYDLLNDFEPVAVLASNPQVIVSKKDLPAQSLRELITWLKEHPDEAAQGTAGAGSPAHITGIYFQKETGTKFRFVPYRGAAPAMQDLLGGQIDLLIDQASNAIGQVRAGRIRAYAVTAKNRIDAEPGIPTVDEAGLPGFYVSVWHGLWAPKSTPRPVIDKLNASAIQALADPVVQKKLAEIGQEIPTRQLQTPEGLRAYQKAEADKWWPMIRAAGVRAQ